MTGTVAQVGLYLGNNDSNPAYTAQVDYFENEAAPLLHQDGVVMPRLRIAAANGQVVISWPADDTTAGFSLQTNPSVAAPSWSAVTNAPVVGGAQNTVTLPTGAQPAFYRLIK